MKIKNNIVCGENLVGDEIIIGEIVKVGGLWGFKPVLGRMRTLSAEVLKNIVKELERRGGKK